jgi:hypothetical protein
MPVENSSPPLLTAKDKELYTGNALTKWRWKASPGACIDYLARDGRKYFYGDVPERPHPNCKCRLEVVGEHAPHQWSTREFFADLGDTLEETAGGTRDALGTVMEHPIAGPALASALVIELTALLAVGGVVAMETALALIWRSLPHLPPAAARFVMANAHRFRDGAELAGGFLPGMPEGYGYYSAFISRLIQLLQNNDTER